MTYDLASGHETVEHDVFALHFLSLFETQFFAQFQHLFLEVAKHLTSVSFQDFSRLLDVLLIVFLALFPYAGPHTFLDVIIQTDLVSSRCNALFRQSGIASTRMIEFLDQMEYASHATHMGVRTIIGAPFLVDRTGLEDAREGLVGDADGRVGLTVFQQDIIARIVLLDERVLKQQRILLRIHHRITDIVDLTDEHLRLETIYLRVEVRRDSCFEILRLTHIDDGMILVIVLVAARLFWQPTYNTFQIG